MNAFLVFLSVAVAGVGPFVAVHIGGNAFRIDDKPESREIDDTTQIPRITVDDDPYMY